MSAQALYRRWRPQSFEDVIGQAHIVRTLRHAVAGDRLAHAYLFTGPRGTGKTSVARILAKAVNCSAAPGETRPCNACPICSAMTEGRSLDLIEIDAASNTGVDDVRDLRDKIGFAPNEARYKVYIVDEAHMLSTAAFNALLKTLEEPPGHALFVLATTEPHKIPDTIRSRCQRHDFRRVSVAEVAAKLGRICAAEGAEAEPAALELIARSATGSIRDAESLLDQLIAGGRPVGLAEVRESIGAPADEAASALVEAMLGLDAAAGLALVNEALDRGADPRRLQGRLIEHLRLLLLIQTGIDPASLDLPETRLAELAGQAARLAPAELVATIHRFNEARPSIDRALPSLPLELALVETVLAIESGRSGGGQATVTAQPGTVPATGTLPASLEPAAAVTAPTVAPVAVPPPAPMASPSAAQAPDAPAASAPGAPEVGSPEALPGSGGALGDFERAWPAIVATVEKRDRNTAALLKDCRPVAADTESLTLGFFFEFHYKRVSEPERSAMVADAVAAVTGARPRLICTVVPASKAEQAARPRSKADQARTDPVVRHAVESLGAQVSTIQPLVEDA